MSAFQVLEVSIYPDGKTTQKQIGGIIPNWERACARAAKLNEKEAFQSPEGIIRSYTVHSAGRDETE